MTKKRLIARILSSEIVSENPPVCVDIGASRALPTEWRILAPYSICVAFDADTREFRADDSSSGGWRRFCSSSLPPDNVALEPWAFSGLFEVVGKVALPAVSLTRTLSELGIRQIDWYKSDSQGTDLRIFASLQTEMIDEVIVADFEPGIIDAYRGEDKLSTVMGFMNSRPFFLSDMKVWGSQRIDSAALGVLGAVPRRFVSSILKMSPGWCEVTYLNDFSAPSESRRKYYLGWVFSTIKEQDGHALTIAVRGLRMFGDAVFDECRRVSLGQMRRRYPRLVLRVLTRALARVVGR